MSKAPDADHYDKMRGGKELPDDPKPVSKAAIKARKNAIREGRLKAPARDTLAAAKKAEAEGFAAAAEADALDVVLTEAAEREIEGDETGALADAAQQNAENDAAAELEG